MWEVVVSSIVLLRKNFLDRQLYVFKSIDQSDRNISCSLVTTVFALTIVITSILLFCSQGSRLLSTTLLMWALYLDPR